MSGFLSAAAAFMCWLQTCAAAFTSAGGQGAAGASGTPLASSADFAMCSWLSASRDSSCTCGLCKNFLPIGMCWLGACEACSDVGQTLMPHMHAWSSPSRQSTWAAGDVSGLTHALVRAPPVRANAVSAAVKCRLRAGAGMAQGWTPAAPDKHAESAVTAWAQYAVVRVQEQAHMLHRPGSPGEPQHHCRARPSLQGRSCDKY